MRAVPINLTDEQRLSVEAKGNILVAAAAGSGKTAVLVERVIKKLCSQTDGISADKLLIVTFTNAAAAEMRGRIEKRLDEECRLHPDNAGLLKQKHLLSSAKICTIDSFCIDLVRENFEKAGVAPDFKISDGNSLKPYDERVMTGIINRYLEDENPVFSRLLDIIGAEYDDFNFLNFALELYYYSRQLPFPKNWFDSLSDFYKSGQFTPDNPWWKYSFQTAGEIIKDARENLASSIDLLSVNEKAADKYLPAFSEVSAIWADISEAQEKNDWDSLYKILSSSVFPSLPRVNGVSGVYEITAAKNIYKYVTDKAIERLRRIFYADLSFINSQFEFLCEPIGLLSEILKEFDEEIFKEYLRINTFTFHNTEQLALTLLCEEKQGEIVIREDAKEFLDRFEEVMVDEYQDTNDLQDMLFYVLSNREQKLFVVGDVKQSIYGFRGANPKNFLEKKNRYIPVAEGNEKDARKIILSKNFRCKPEVCDFINYFFKSFMTEDKGGIIYDSEEELVAGASYPETQEIPISLNMINCKGSDLPDIVCEARFIADYIRKTMNSGAVIRVDSENLRPAKYSDFTVLMRSVKNKAPILASELKRQGIPVNFSTEGYAESYEVATLLALLKVIDNPKSDIELLSVMMSPMFGFTAEDMAQIRVSDRKSDIYSAVIKASANNKKASDFLETIKKYRLAAVTTPLPVLISYLINDTGYIDIVSALSEGEKRRGNLLLLSSYANQYVRNNGSGIGGFVRYILKQSENGIKSADSGSGGDTVKIMSIHASKGLQFPVTIVSGIASDFNDSESGESSLISTDFGIGFKYFDEDIKEKVTTIGREIILERIRKERLEEELRLLYVAMTRTQDRLVFTASVSDVYKKIDSLKTLLISSNSEITASLWKKTKSYFDWIALCAIIHPDGKELRGNGTSIFVMPDESHIDINIINADELPDCLNEENQAETALTPDITDAIYENISYKYPFEDILSIESKASVSSIANKAESDKYAFSVEPSFMSKGGITATGRGTATHKVMQFIDFSKADDIEGEIERLYEWQFITETEAQAVNRESLKNFFESNVFGRILRSETVKREMRFLTELPARLIDPELDSNFNSENIIVQGAVDICFVEEDGVVVLDFKTDRVENPNQLKEAYGEQLSIYAKACEKIFEKPVKQKLIYSFALSKEITVD